jgi:hypothetical protein
MPFLRDLFLCMVAAPLLVRLPASMLWAVAGAAALSQLMGWGAPVLMRPAILFFFVIGMMAQRTGLAERAASLGWMAAVLPFLLLMSVQLHFALKATAGVPIEIGLLDLAVRVAAALCFWRLSWALAGSPVRAVLLRIEPYAFFLFCSHLILIWLGGPVLGALFGKLGSPLYPAYLLIQPLLVLVAVLILGSMLSRAWPSMAKVLSGGRLIEG